MDRDGTINEQMGYINHISRFVLLPTVVDAVKLLNHQGYWAIVVSNQSGVARGYFPLELVDQVHAHMRALLKETGAFLDGIYYCPHYPKGILPEYSIQCRCRKPKKGLIDQACMDFDIDIDHSYVIGDRSTDIEMAHNAGLKGILVKTGYGRGEMEYVLPHNSCKPVHVAEDLLHAVQWILSKK